MCIRFLHVVVPISKIKMLFLSTLVAIAYLLLSAAAFAIPRSPVVQVPLQISLETTTAIVRTEAGLVQGSTSEHNSSITVYKGIPYASSTAGEHRWRPARPLAPWDGIHIADTFGDICPQPFPKDLASPVGMSEDCLNLNIWTPARSGDEKFPVYLWIPGEAFKLGVASHPSFDGAGLAAKGLVVVTINYRLGAFGFLSHPELSEESSRNSSGNYGLMDQITALEWVQKNIANFGGDPGHVTVGGQSVGAASVLDIVNSRLSRGLVHGAIAHSGARYAREPHRFAMRHGQLEDNEVTGIEITSNLNISSIAELRDIPAEKLLESTDSLHLGPVFDGYVISDSYENALASGNHADIPILTGNNLDESGAELEANTTLFDYITKSKARYGIFADEFFELYPASNDEEARSAAIDAARDSLLSSTWLWGNAWANRAESPVYTYLWTHAPPQNGGRGRGASHGSEILFTFNNLDTVDEPWTKEDREIAEMMSTHWANFIRTGNPDGPSEGRDGWQASTSDEPKTMMLGNHVGVADIAEDDKIRFFTRFFNSNPPS